MSAAGRGESAGAERWRTEIDPVLMEELSRLNNELATAQRELARNNAELARLNAQKNALLGIAAHDLRNPLDVIASYSRFLLEDDGLAEDERERFLRRIMKSSEFMRGLVDELLDYARIEAGRLELDRQACDVAALVEENVALNGVIAEARGLRIVLERGEAARARVDVSKIEQVLNNLIGNAVKFSPPGGTITVRVGADGAGVVIEVRDQGPGIAPEAIERIFEPFEKGGAVPRGGDKGAGLGLAIVRHIVHGHDGRISVSSRPGGGSLFQIHLPAACADASAGERTRS